MSEEIEIKSRYIGRNFVVFGLSGNSVINTFEDTLLFCEHFDTLLDIYEAYHYNEHIFDVSIGA